MVRLAPRIHTPCPAGAISAGAWANTGMASPGPTPAAAKPPAIRRARSCTSPQLCRIGQLGSPVTRPLELDWAGLYIFSVNLLKAIPGSTGPAAQGWRVECTGTPSGTPQKGRLMRRSPLKHWALDPVDAGPTPCRCRLNRTVQVRRAGIWPKIATGRLRGAGESTTTNDTAELVRDITKRGARTTSACD